MIDREAAQKDIYKVSTEKVSIQKAHTLSGFPGFVLPTLYLICFLAQTRNRFHVLPKESWSSSFSCVYCSSSNSQRKAQKSVL